jgi:PDZ domain/WG containing repeat
MKQTLRLLLVCFLLAFATHGVAKEAVINADNQLIISTDKAGRKGASNANGKTIVPFKYDYISKIERSPYLLVGLPNPKAGGSEPYVYGVVNQAGKLIVPVQYAGVNYDDDFKHFRVILDAPNNATKLGYINVNGKVVIPVIYDYLERISNMGGEPTNLAKLNGKYGYINIVTGRILIPFEYDSLHIDSLNIDMNGQGIVVAQKNKKFGVLATNGKILAPFEFDKIGDISYAKFKDIEADIKIAIAEKNGELVELKFKNNQYLGVSESSKPINIEYSSNFVPRRVSSINAKPLDGMYAATDDYPDMKAAWNAAQANKLRWVAIPSVQIENGKAYVAFGQFDEGMSVLMPNELQATYQKNGFTIFDDMEDASGKRVPKTSFKFTEQNGVMICSECASYDMPVRWHKVQTKKSAAFVGIGVAIQKRQSDPFTVGYAGEDVSPEVREKLLKAQKTNSIANGINQDAYIEVIEVLKNGPAEKAGLKNGDLISQIDEMVTLEISIAQATNAIKGAAGTKVKLYIVRAGNPLPKPIVVTREPVKIN